MERQGAEGTDRDSFSRWRDRQYFGPRRWLENALREPWNNSDGSGESGRSSSSKAPGQAGPSGSGPQASSTPLNQSSPIWLSDEIEYWPDGTRNLKFTAIAAMHSELIAIGTNGSIYQWKWIDVEPFRHHEVTQSTTNFTNTSVSANLFYERSCVISNESLEKA